MAHIRKEVLSQTAWTTAWELRPGEWRQVAWRAQQTNILKKKVTVENNQMFTSVSIFNYEP